VFSSAYDKCFHDHVEHIEIGISLPIYKSIAYSTDALKSTRKILMNYDAESDFFFFFFGGDSSSACVMVAAAASFSAFFLAFFSFFVSA
jgi:hypothetical protein